MGLETIVTKNQKRNARRNQKRRSSQLSAAQWFADFWIPALRDLETRRCGSNQVSIEHGVAELDDNNVVCLRLTITGFFRITDHCQVPWFVFRQYIRSEQPFDYLLHGQWLCEWYTIHCDDKVYLSRVAAVFASPTLLLEYTSFDKNIIGLIQQYIS